jgi:NitT/TauT family transport system permease protein
MLVHFGWSAFRVLTGLLIALFLAVPLGLAIGFGKRANDYISPLIYTIYPIPMVAFLPVFFVLIGIGEATRITLIVLVVFFQILLSARDAAKNVPQSYIISVLAAGGNKRQIYRHVIIPASMPAVLSGARISVGWAIIVMYLTEVFYTNVGLGYYITSSWQVFNFVDMFVGIMGIAILGMMLYAILDATERVVCRWKYV